MFGLCGIILQKNMVQTTRNIAGEHLIEGKARLISPKQIRVNDVDIQAEKIIIATGARPKMPDAWKALEPHVMTSETIFEQMDLPHRIAIIGLGPIGLEIGQALSRLGLDITGFTTKPTLTLTSNPSVNAKAFDIFSQEFPMMTQTEVDIHKNGKTLKIVSNSKEMEFDAALVAIGGTPNLDGLGLENLGIQLNQKGLPPYNPQTMQIEGLPVFIAGDVNGCRPILHEALDEGFIAGKNSLSEKNDCYCRRTTLRLIFSDPQIAVVGKSYRQLKEEKNEFIVGEVDFKEQSRATLEMDNKGLLEVYANSKTAKILGAEFVCPDAEHLAHQFAMAIQHEWTVFDMLKGPFYHPTVEEAIRSVMQDMGHQFSSKSRPELSLCDSCPESPLC